MTDLPTEVREKAAKAAWYSAANAASWELLKLPTQDRWRAVVDAVAEVLEADDDTSFPWGLHLNAAFAELAKARESRLRLLETLDDMDRKLSRQRKRRKAAEAKVAELAKTCNETLGGLTNYDRRCREIAAERDALAKTIAEQAEKAERARKVYEATAHELLREKDAAVAERDALLARVGNLRAALEKLAKVSELYVVHAALAADDRAAGRTEGLEDFDG